IFLTKKHCVIHLSGRTDGTGPIPWEEIRTWGIAQEGTHDPLLGIKTDDRVFLVSLTVNTPKMAEEVADFVEKFNDFAPDPVESFVAGDPFSSDAFQTEGSIDVKHQKRTLASGTRRLVLTTVGLTLIVVAALIGWIPGPWSIPLVIAGLAVLAREYDWAKDLLDWLKQKRDSATKWLKAKRGSAD
ncbi:MAG TPA: PGPGW domain-containing protein, partial [Actinomycetota bacterium]|nr:PGPGW domain-containing protein [Actinomycetota bacterium]